MPYFCRLYNTEFKNWVHVIFKGESDQIELSLNETFLKIVKDSTFKIGGQIQFGNSDMLSWNTFDQTMRFINGTVIHSEYKAYTIFTLKEYFLMFVGIQILHVLIIYILKRNLSEAFKQFNGLEQFIHCVETTHLVINAEEWDSPKGNAQAHIDRMLANRTEGLALIFVNMIFKFGMLFPIYILGKIK